MTYNIPKVKICGITREEEILFLNEEAPEYAGFVCYPKSRRNVSLEKAKCLMVKLDSNIQKVAVVVSPSKKEMDKVIKTGFDIIQIHGKMKYDAVNDIKIPIWKAVNIGTENIREFFELSPDIQRKLSGYLADGASYGGGVPFHWEETEEIVGKIKEKGSFILAGGLDSENVCEGIRRFAPEVVDVSTGVETHGYKDKEKIRRFIRKVRGHE